MNLENHIVPVTDVDRAKAFYEQLGWRLDDDVAPMEELRFVQFTPPGSGPQSPSAWDSPRPLQDQSRPRLSSPTSRRPMTRS